jgi:hypothetical protein
MKQALTWIDAASQKADFPFSWGLIHHACTIFFMN